MTDLIGEIEDILASEYERTGKRSLQVKAVDRISAVLDRIREEEQTSDFNDQFGIGYKYDDTIHPCPSEESARRSFESVETITLHKRRVGPWEQVE